MTIRTVRWQRIPGTQRLERLPDPPPDETRDDDVGAAPAIAATLLYVEETMARVQAFAAAIRQDLARHQALFARTIDSPVAWQGVPARIAPRSHDAGPRPRRRGVGMGRPDWHGDVHSALLLRSARQVAGLSQWRLATQLRCSRGLIGEVERGRRSAPPWLLGWARDTLEARYPTPAASGAPGAPAPVEV